MSKGLHKKLKREKGNSGDRQVRMAPLKLLVGVEVCGHLLPDDNASAFTSDVTAARWLFRKLRRDVDMK